jgi:hypothetical protein
MKKIIIDMVTEMKGTGTLHFDDPISVKKTPHSIPVKMWAVCVRGDRIALMDSDQIWHELEEGDINYHLVIASLYQRVIHISKNVKTA